MVEAPRFLELKSGGPPAPGEAWPADRLQHLLDPDRADLALAEVLAGATDKRLTNLSRAFSVVAHIARPRREDLDERVEALRRDCSPDGYERFILNWAGWMHGLALRDPQRAQLGIGQQYEYLQRARLAETWLTSYSLAVTHMIDGVSGREEFSHALDIARREGYRIVGECMLALAYASGSSKAIHPMVGLMGASSRFSKPRVST